MDADYLALLEQLHRDKISFHYASITRDDSIVGLMYFQVIRFEGNYLRNYFRTDEHTGLLKRVLFGMLDFLLRFQYWNLMVAGNIFFTGERGIYFKEDVPVGDSTDLIHKSFELARRAEKKKITAYMMNNVYDDNNAFIHHYLNNFRYATYPVDPDMFMHFDPEWQDFDDYLAALSSKYRVRARKVLQTSRPIKSRFLSIDEMRENREAIHELYLATAGQVDFNLGYLDRAYFCEMKELWGEKFLCTGYFLDEKLVGFMSLLVVNSDIDVNYMGMDYDHNRDYKLYNRMLLDLVEAGIRTGTRTMHLGRTATEIKSTIGARARSMKIYLYSPSDWRTRGMRLFESYFGSPQYTLRHPLKSE